MQQNPEDLVHQMQHAALDTLAVFGVSSIEDPGLSASPTLFTLLEENQFTTPILRLEIIATLPLTERPLLLICLESPEPHI